MSKEIKKEEDKTGDLERFIVDRSPEGIYVLDRDGRIVHANKACSSMLGYSRQELKQMNVREISPYFEKEAWEESWKRLREAGTGLRETEHRTKDGQLIPVQVTAHFFRTDGEEYNCAFVHDIGRIKQSEEKYRFLYANGPLVNVIIGVDGQILEVNQPTLELLGYSREEVVGKEALDFVVHGQKQQVAEELGRGFRGEESPELEVDLLTKDDSVRTILFSPGQVVIRQNGEPTSILVSGLDITDRKRAEQRLLFSDDIIQRVSAIILVCDSEGLIMYASPAIKEILGYEPDEVLGNKWWTLTRDSRQEAEAERDYAARSVRGEIKLFDEPYERLIKNRDGEKRRVIWRESRGPEGSLIGIGHDITDQKKAEEMATRSQELLRTIYDTIPEAVISTDMNLEIVTCNRAVQKVLGYRPEELKGQNYTILISDEMVKQPEQKRREEDLFEKGYLEQEEFIFKKKSGETFSGSFSVAVIKDPGGNPSGLVGTIQDVSQRKEAEEKIRAHAERQEALHEASQTLSSSLEITSVVDSCASIAKEYLGADGVVIFLKVKGGKYLKPIASKGSYGTEVLSMTLELGEGISGRVAETGKSEIINRIDQTDLGKQVPGTPVEPESLLSVPLTVKRKTIGVMTLDRLGEREFSQDDLSFLEDLASICAVSIDNAIAYDQARKESEGRKDAESMLKASQDEIRKLTLDLEGSGEQRQIAIAQRIHEELRQAFSDVKTDLMTLKKGLPEESTLVQKTDTFLKLIDGSYEKVKQISEEMSLGDRGEAQEEPDS